MEMGLGKYEKLEARLHELCEAGDYPHAVELALEGYGPEIRGLMRSMLRREDRVDDAFSAFAESLVKSLPGFQWKSAFRTWAYSVARSHCLKLLRGSHNRELLVSDRLLQEALQRERTVTQPWLRTEVKNRFHTLQSRLSPQEQLLLELRLRRQLPWNEIARQLYGRQLSAAELQKRATSLRQQFQRLKSHLRELAHEGLLGSSSSG